MSSSAKKRVEQKRLQTGSGAGAGAPAGVSAGTVAVTCGAQNVQINTNVDIKKSIDELIKAGQSERERENGKMRELEEVKEKVRNTTGKGELESGWKVRKSREKAREIEKIG